MRECGVHEIPAAGVQDAFGLARRAGGVEDEQRVLGIHHFGRAGVRLLRHQFAIPSVPRLIHRNGRAGVPHDQHVFDAFRALDAQRLIDEFLQRYALAAAKSLIGGDDQDRVTVRYPAAQCLGGEAGEDDGVNGSNARACEHRDGDVRDHRQVDRHAIPFLDAERSQSVRASADPLVKLAVADVFAALRVIRLPDDRGLVAAGFEVPIQAIAGDVELAVVEPADVAILRREARVLDVRKFLDPIDAPADEAPE